MAASASPVEEPTSVITLTFGGNQPAPHHMLGLDDPERLRAGEGHVCPLCSIQKESGTHAVDSTASRGQLHELLRRAPRDTTGNELRAWLLAAST